MNPSTGLILWTTLFAAFLLLLVYLIFKFFNELSKK
jgi:hypothetical protein